MEKITNAGLRALTTSKERQELRAFGTPPIKWVLKFHKGSERTGRKFGIDCRIWDVISPRLPWYVYKEDSGPVTLSLEGIADAATRLGDTRVRRIVGPNGLKAKGA